MEFISFPKIARISRECIISEKLDGTNAQITILDDGITLIVGSRTKYITPGKNDNYGFAGWVENNKEEILKLGPGQHFGEWWGKGIQRGYGIDNKRFSLFNSIRWADENIRPKCCSVVPILAQGIFTTQLVEGVLERLRSEGSIAAPGFMKPEGIIIYHVAANIMFKKTLEKDESPKGIDI